MVNTSSSLPNWIEGASPIAVFSLLLIYAGSLFQMGYFFVVGLNFLSMAGVTDWIFYVTLEGAVVLIIVAIAFVLAYLRPKPPRTSLFRALFAAILLGGALAICL